MSPTAKKTPHRYSLPRPMCVLRSGFHISAQAHQWQSQNRWSDRLAQTEETLRKKPSVTQQLQNHEPSTALCLWSLGACPLGIPIPPEPIENFPFPSIAVGGHPMFGISWQLVRYAVGTLFLSLCLSLSSPFCLPVFPRVSNPFQCRCTTRECGETGRWPCSFGRSKNSSSLQVSLCRKVNLLNLVLCIFGMSARFLALEHAVGGHGGCVCAAILRSSAAP